MSPRPLRGREEEDGYLKMAAEKSLERCQTSKFDLLMLHNPLCCVVDASHAAPDAAPLRTSVLFHFGSIAASANASTQSTFQTAPQVGHAVSSTPSAHNQPQSLWLQVRANPSNPT